MNKLRNIVIWTICAVAVLAVVTWLYTRDSERQVEHNQNAGSIETGIALFKEKKYTEAIDIFERVQPGHPQEWYSLYYLGSSYIMLRDYPAAAEHLEQALSLNPTETQIMHALGITYFKLGNLKLSKAYFAAVLDINPDDAEARGLMEIMAKLERQQPGVNQEKPPEPGKSEANDH